MSRPRRFLTVAAALLLLAAAVHSEQTWPKAPPAPAGDPAQAFTFGVMGDNRGDPLPPVYIEIIKRLTADAPAFVINTGDIIPGTTDLEKANAQLDAFIAGTAALDAPMYVTYGNHEQRDAATLEMLERRIGPRYMAFTYGNSRFYLLNTELVRGQIVGEQLDWFIRDLATEGQRVAHRFVFQHRPLYSPMNDTGRRKWGDPANLATLSQALADYRVDAVFCGHDHYFAWRIVDGVTHVVTGGGGAPLYAAPGALSVNHYLLVRVDGSQVVISLVPVEPAPAEKEPAKP